MNKAYFVVISIIVIISILGGFIAGSNGYKRGYSQGTEDYKNEHYIYYDAWDLSESYPNFYSEYITLDNSIFSATRIEKDYYSLDWDNIKLSDEGFSIYCITPGRGDSRCELRIVNNQCIKSENILLNLSSCYKYFVYRPEHK